MHFVDVIARKRDGHSLTRQEIDHFVAGASSGAIPDYQTSALLMAVVLRGMTEEETAWLTEAMLRSGERLDLSDLPGVKVGKHSTGGVGDKVSIALAPLAAASGAVVPKLSGRGLGHTGGTIDKLESIPGFRVDLSIPEFKEVVRAVGTSITAQTKSLAPADKKLYALRDVTGTVESIPLISSSIMSKKLAEGTSALVLDVKCGHGAFMKDLDSARALARSMVATGARAGVRAEAVITSMDAPLGRAVGNAVEIAECIEMLSGSGPSELTDLIVRLAGRMLVAGGLRRDADAEAVVRRALESGAALERLKAMIAAQGGDPRVVDDPARLPRARHRELVRAHRSGYVASLDAGLVGRSAVALGAGREAVGAPIDHAAGILIAAGRGDLVSAGDAVLELLYNDSARLEDARHLAESAVRIDDAPPAVKPLVLDSVR
ncbi:MAG TPA: thymidine phosphorylase [Vicinamibacterales bacterium]|nr:thymidine phosphorylase [Vicinamibacterales bacterium]